MPYLTNSNGRKLYVQRRISTDEILKRNIIYPAAVDDTPIQGLDPDLEYLGMFQDIPPDYDSRYFILNKIEGKDLINNNWHISWSTVKRPNAEIALAVNNIDQIELQKQINAANVAKDKMFLLGLTVLFRRIENLTLTAKEQALADLIVSKGVTVWKNDDYRKVLINLINSGAEPDLDTGWEDIL